MRAMEAWLVSASAVGALLVAVSCSDDTSETSPTGAAAGGGTTAAGGGGDSGGAGGAEPFEIDPNRIYADAAWLADSARQGRDPAGMGIAPSWDGGHTRTSHPSTVEESAVARRISRMRRPVVHRHRCNYNDGL